MKKIALILMICVYSLSTLGIGVKQFYCCGKLKTTNISFLQQQETKESCVKRVFKPGCCKTQFKTFKIKDNHMAADAISTPVKQFIDLHLFTPSFEVTALAKMPITVTNTSNAPPLYKGVPIYILNCIYRI